MNQTKHIDFTFAGREEAGFAPVLFPEQNLVISFAAREDAEAAMKECMMSGHPAIRLYAKEVANGS